MLCVGRGMCQSVLSFSSSSSLVAHHLVGWTVCDFLSSCVCVMHFRKNRSLNWVIGFVPTDLRLLTTLLLTYLAGYMRHVLQLFDFQALSEVFCNCSRFGNWMLVLGFTFGYLNKFYIEMTHRFEFRLNFWLIRILSVCTHYLEGWGANIFAW